MTTPTPPQASSRPSRAIIDDCTKAVFTPLALRAALELDIFTTVAKGADGRMTPAELAAALNCDQRRLEMLLYQLVLAEFLEIEDGRFSNSEVADYYLVKERPAYTGDIHELWSAQWSAMMQTAGSIRDGVAKGEVNYARMSEPELAGFFRGMHGTTLAAGHRLGREIDVSASRKLLDVGGGSGGVAIALCQDNPELTATVLDLPSVTPIAEKLIAEAGLSERISVETADILAAPLTGDYDIAVARAFLQVLSADDARLATVNIAGALAPGGNLYILGHITADDRLSPEITVGFNLIFLNMFENGQAYSEKQYREWLAAGGYGNITKKPFPGGTTILSAQLA